MPPTRVAEPAFDVERQATDAPSRPGSRDAAWAADRVLDALLVAFAAWTAVYDVCLLLGLHAEGAAVLWALALAACAWLALRPGRRDGEPWAPHARRLPRLSRPRLLLTANVAAGATAAAVLALTSVAWWFVWIAWLVAAACAAVWCATRAEGRVEAPAVRRARLESAVVAAWALGLAALSLFILNSDSDDAQYVHLSTWTAQHGIFPLRDVMFSDQGLPALFYPPASSYEPLLGTLARIGPVAVPDIVYLVVPPVTAILSVLVTWRLLRAWRVPSTWLAVSVASVFLVFSATTTRGFGVFALTRGWQGKSLLAVVLAPLAVGLAYEYAERPTRRALALLACAGVAAVGLSTTAIFLVPVIALGAMALVALRSVAVAARGFAALAGYPLAVGVVSLAVGGRAPDKAYSVHDLQPQNLMHLVFGANALTLLMIAAILIAPALLPEARAGAMVAGAALVVGCLLAPRLPATIFRATGLGRELSRLIWAVPVAALFGALATVLGADRPRVMRYLPAVVAIAAVALVGRPVWSSALGTRLAHGPTWKRWPSTVEAARGILARSHPGDVVLAPRGVSETLLVMSADVLPVGTRPQYVRALGSDPRAHMRERMRLVYLVGRTPQRPSADATVRATQVRRIRRALLAVKVDLACVGRNKRPWHALLVDAGFTRPVAVPGLACLRAPR